jgi:hypothetical protein
MAIHTEGFLLPEEISDSSCIRADTPPGEARLLLRYVASSFPASSFERPFGYIFCKKEKQLLFRHRVAIAVFLARAEFLGSSLVPAPTIFKESIKQTEQINQIHSYLKLLLLRPVS